MKQGSHDHIVKGMLTESDELFVHLPQVLLRPLVILRGQGPYLVFFVEIFICELLLESFLKLFRVDFRKVKNFLKNLFELDLAPGDGGPCFFSVLH